MLFTDLRYALPRRPENHLSYRSLDAIEFLVIHWDGGARIPETYDPVAYYVNEADYHIRKTWGWANDGQPYYGHGLMYHIKIDRAGRAYLTRNADEVLWHASGANEEGYAICVDCTDGQPPTAAQMATLRKVIERKRLEFKLTHERVRGHGELVEYGNSTACPGEVLLDWLRRYRAGAI